MKVTCPPLDVPDLGKEESFPSLPWKGFLVQQGQEDVFLGPSCTVSHRKGRKVSYLTFRIEIFFLSVLERCVFKVFNLPKRHEMFFYVFKFPTVLGSRSYDLPLWLKAKGTVSLDQGLNFIF
jgi:hypothetical protein